MMTPVYFLILNKIFKINNNGSFARPRQTSGFPVSFLQAENSAFSGRLLNKRIFIDFLDIQTYAHFRLIIHNKCINRVFYNDNIHQLLKTEKKSKKPKSQNPSSNILLPNNSHTSHKNPLPPPKSPSNSTTNTAHTLVLVLCLPARPNDKEFEHGNFLSK